MNQHFLRARLANDEEAAVSQRRDSRECGVSQSLPFGFDRPGCESELFRAPQNFIGTDPSTSQAMSNLLKINVDAVVAQQKEEANKPGVVPLHCFGVGGHKMQHSEQDGFTGLAPQLGENGAKLRHAQERRRFLRTPLTDLI